MSHEEAALWSAPLGVAVTHSPNVGSRSGCRAEVWAATSYGWNPGVREQGRKAGGPLLESSGSLYWPTRETPCFCVSWYQEGCHRCASECPCQLLPVKVRHWHKGVKVPVPDTMFLCQRCSKLFLEAVPTPQQHLVIKFTFGRWGEGAQDETACFLRLAICLFLG